MHKLQIHAHLYMNTNDIIIHHIVSDRLCHRKVTHFQFRKFNLESADRLFG